MALEALWMLGLAGQPGFRECARYHVSATGIPGNVEGAGFFDSLGRNAGLSARSELPPETGSVPAPLESREIRHVRVPPSRQAVGVVGSSQIVDAKLLIHNHTFGTGTQKRGVSLLCSRLVGTRGGDCLERVEASFEYLGTVRQALKEPPPALGLEIIDGRRKGRPSPEKTVRRLQLIREAGSQ